MGKVIVLDTISDDNINLAEKQYASIGLRRASSINKINEIISRLICVIPGELLFKPENQSNERETKGVEARIVNTLLDSNTWQHIRMRSPEAKKQIKNLKEAKYGGFSINEFVESSVYSVSEYYYDGPTVYSMKRLRKSLIQLLNQADPSILPHLITKSAMASASAQIIIDVDLSDTQKNELYSLLDKHQVERIHLGDES